MKDIYKNIEEYNPNKKRKILIVFDNMIVDMLNKKNFNPIVTELFIRGRKLNLFITQSCFDVPEKYQAKLYAPFCYQNSKQKRTSTNCFLTFIRY